MPEDSRSDVNGSKPHLAPPSDMFEKSR